jgi:hypothetical protein
MVAIGVSWDAWEDGIRTFVGPVLILVTVFWLIQRLKSGQSKVHAHAPPPPHTHKPPASQILCPNCSTLSAHGRPSPTAVSPR